MTIITVAAVNTTANPLWNGPEINWGKNCLPVSTAALTPGCCRTPEEPSSSQPKACKHVADYIDGITCLSQLGGPVGADSGWRGQSAVECVVAKVRP